MKPKKNPIESKSASIYILISRIFTPLIFSSLLLSSSISQCLVPDFAKITKIQDLGDEGEGVTINSRPAKLGDKLTQYDDELTIAPTLGSKNNFANLDLVKKGVKPLWIKATAKDGQRTVYQIPCQLKEDRYAEAEITWSNGKKSVCGEGVRVSPNSRKIANFTNRQDIQMPQAIVIANAKNIAIDIAQQSPSWNYYCSSVPNSMKGFGNFALETTSIEDACQNSQQECRTYHRKDCSIATMGRWNINDSNLKMSSMCYDNRISEYTSLFTGKSLYKSLKRKRISRITVLPKKIPGDDATTKIITAAFILDGSNFPSCYLQIYSSDKILISPLNNQLTKVNTYGLEDGIKVDVLEGQVELHSTKNPEGILARKGENYFFDGSGLVRREGQGEPASTPTPATPPVPIQPPSSPPIVR
jgi:hypothetical protein